MNSCESPYNNIASIIKNTKHNNIDTLTFLKSNYKYKRRFGKCMSEELPLTTEMLHKKNVKECSRSSSKNCSSRRATMSVIAAAAAVKSKSDILLTFRIILRLFIAIVGNFIKHIKTTIATKEGCLHEYRNNVVNDVVAVVDDDDDDVDSSSSNSVDDDVYNVDSDEINYQQNYDKVSNDNVPRQPPRCNKNSENVSRRHLHRERHNAAILCQWLWRWRHLGNLSVGASKDFSIFSTSSLMLVIGSSRRTSVAEHSVSRRCFNVLSIILTLFITLAALSVRSVAAGECWLQALDNGNCNKMFSRNLTKAECCNTDQDFSYTDRDLTSVEYFFATSIGEGVKCAPCIESCKNVLCGLNKKCIKRNGRPKCICAPECGAAMRRRQQQEQQQQQKRGKLFRGHEHHNEQIRVGVLGGRESGVVEAGMIFEKSPRDIRSLSSEITNINLGLDGVMRHANQNQRKQIIIMQQSQQSQQKPQNIKIKREPKPGRLLTTAYVEHSVEEKETPTTTSTRRLQILSNVGIRNSGSNGNGGNSNRKSNGGNDGADGRRIKENSTKMSTSSSSSPSSSSSLSMETTRRGSIMSRHKLDNEHTNNHKNRNKKKPNTNELELNRNQPQQQQQQQENDKKIEETEIHETTHISQHSNNNNARFRHIHQNVRIHEVADDEVVANNKHHQQHQHRQHHRQRQNEHHQHEFHRKRKQHNNNGNHQRSKQKKQHKDQQNNANNSTRTTAIMPSSASSETYSTSSKISSSLSAATSNTTITLSATTITAPVNSMSSASAAVADHQHSLLNRGSNSATSSSSPSATATFEGVSAHRHRANDKDSSNSINSNDLTSLDGIYDKFNFHGFPSQQHEIMQFENVQHAAHPVCGTDGRTYTTECQLRKRACRTDNPTLQVAYRGHCKTTCNGVKCLNGLTCVEDHYRIPHCIACSIDCPEDHHDGIGDDYNDDHSSSDVIDPVCGVDGKTYRSTCDINRMICKIGRSIAVAYPGRCRADRVTCNDVICGSKHTCLVDLLTHEPRCVSCRYKCSRKRRPASLRFEEGKICGVNNRTYNSWCEMRKDSCNTGFFIDVKSPGEC